MLSTKEKGIIYNIIKHCRRIEEKINNINREIFDKSEDIKEIVCFNILQIGELAKGFDKNFLNKYNKMPWKDIKGMRDWVAHGYGTINWNDVWNTASKDIAALRIYCEDILASQTGPVEKIKQGEKEDVSKMSTYNPNEEW